jgi:hypothetical protein
MLSDGRETTQENSFFPTVAFLEIDRGFAKHRRAGGTAPSQRLTIFSANVRHFEPLPVTVINPLTGPLPA